MTARHQLCYTMFYALLPSAKPGSTKSEACSMQGAQKWTLLLWWFYTLLPSLKLDIPTASALANLYTPPPSHTHTSPACHIHYRVQFTYWCAGVTRCVKSIYRDDYLLLLAVHPAIEVFTTSNSVLYVTRCRCVNWQDCARELSSSTSSIHGRI